MFEVIDFSSWQIYNGASEGSGRSEKEWLISPDGQRTGLFKYPKTEFTTEHVSEHLAHQLGDILDVKTAEVDLGIRNGRIGSISYLINSNTQQLIEGVRFISGRYPKFNADTMVDEDNGNYYCLSMIEESMRGYINLDPIVEMLMFDYLIGNADRHQSNWALIADYADGQKNRVVAWMSPLYDNGSSLCCYVTDEHIQKMNGNDPGPFNALVDTKSRSIVRIEGSRKKQPTHKEMARYLLQHYRSASQVADRFLKRLSDTSIISDLLNQYPDDVLPKARKDLIYRFLFSKIIILRELMCEAGGKA